MGYRHSRLLTRALFAVPVAVCIAFALLLAVGEGGPTVPFLGDLTLFCLSAYATACAVLAVRAATGRMRAAWTVMVGALGAWAAADLIWLLCDHVLHVDPFPSPADLFYLAFTILAVPGLLAMAPYGTDSRRQAKLRIFLDGITVALCVFLLLWLLVLHSVYEAHRDDKLALTLALFYPAADIVILAVAVAVLARVDARQRAALGLLVVGFGIMTVTDSAFAYAVAEDSYVTGSFIDVGWAVASALIAIAALVFRRKPPPGPATVSVPSAATMWAPYLPLLLVGTVGPPLVTTGLERYAAPLIVVTVCLRQFVAAWENRQWLKAAAENSLRDPLTGLANSTLFLDRLAHVMMLHARDDRPVMVASLDLDDFAFVNHNLGHPAADRLLRHAARRIAGCVRPGDTVGRVGGDEFALLLEGDVHDSQRVLQQVVATFDEPFPVDGHEVTLRCSVGVAVVFDNDPDVTPEAMLTRAHSAVQAAKQSRFPRVRFFEDDMEQTDPTSTEDGESEPHASAMTGAAKVRLLSDLRRAVDHGDLELVYQPKVDLVGGQIVGVESLLRWTHPELGLLYPSTFMPLVREHTLLRPVTDLVIDRALDDAARWATVGAQLPVAVNLSAPSLRDPRLPATLREALDHRSLPTEVLTVEITEDLVINDLDQATGVLEQLRLHGIRVAIDDFGSGYSALSYLWDLSIDEIKLDRHFISSVTTKPRAAVVVRSIIELTHRLGMTVVAEGIEEASTAKWLRDNECDIGQGYYFGKPISADDVPDLARLTVGH